MPEKFNIEEMEKRIRVKLRPPTRSPIQRLREIARLRKPKTPRV